MDKLREQVEELRDKAHQRYESAQEHFKTWPLAQHRAYSTVLALMTAALRQQTPAVGEDALVDARERGYDDACAKFMAFATQDAEADYRKWCELNPNADLRSAWIAGRANESAAEGVKVRSGAIAAAQQVVDAMRERLNELQKELDKANL